MVVIFDKSAEKAKTRYPLQDNGLSADEEWRGRRDDYRTDSEAWKAFLAEFREWCESMGTNG